MSDARRRGRARAALMVATLVLTGCVATDPCAGRDAGPQRVASGAGERDGGAVDRQGAQEHRDAGELGTKDDELGTKNDELGGRDAGDAPLDGDAGDELGGHDAGDAPLDGGPTERDAETEQSDGKAAQGCAGGHLLRSR